MYLDRYNFNYRKEVKDKIIRKNNLLVEYNSEVYLKNLKENIEKDYLLFHFLEENINVKINKQEVNYPEIFLFEVFSSLILYVDTENYYCKAINKENIRYRFQLIEEVCKKSYGVKNEIEKIKRILEDKDDTLLFYNTNEYRVIKCLIGNPYLKNERLSFNRKGFYLENFIDNIEIPILLNEKIENNKVEMIGEIDTLLLAEVTFIKKLKEKINVGVQDFKFLYKLNIEKENEKIKKINIEIKLKMDNFWEISEMSCLEGKAD